MSARSFARWAVTLMALVLGGCPPPASPPTTADASAICQPDSLPACEQAIVAAQPRDMGALIEAYAQASGEPAWRSLWEGMQITPGRPLLVHSAAPPAGMSDVQLLASEAKPGHLPLETMLWALGRAAGRSHIFVATPAQAAQIFPLDVLETHCVGLPAIVGADLGHLKEDVALAGELRATIQAAQQLDYLGAARSAARLSATVAGRARDDEAAMRARFALRQLDIAGITLDDPAEDEAEGEATDDSTQAAQPPPFGPKSSPYADWLAVKLTDDGQDRAWQQRRSTIVAAVRPDMVAALDALHAPADTCVDEPIPPMSTVADLPFASMLARSLDARAAPGDAPTAGRASVESWLPLYDRLSELVQQQGATWAFASPLLAQRGELHGLSAEGTTTYGRVTDLALGHVEALSRLAAAEPGRFQTMAVVSLVYQQGVLRDRKLREAVAQLMQQSVAAKLAAAADVSDLWEAAAAAFAAGLSYPPQMQGPHFGALRQALASALGGPVGRRGGWGVAGLHAGSALLGVLLGSADDLAAAAPRVAEALRAASDLPYPDLGNLVISAASYAELLGGDALDPSVSNPAMFPPARTRARAALNEAIAGLAEAGPADGPERELRDGVADFADGMVAAVSGYLRRADTGPSCGGQRVSKASPLRDSFDRLRKSRRRLVELPAFTSTAGEAWAKRARLLTLVLSDLLDLVDRRGEQQFTVEEGAAQRIVEQALSSWGEPEVGQVVAATYLLARSALADDDDASPLTVKNAVRALRGLAHLFAGDGQDSAAATLLSALADGGAGDDTFAAKGIDALLIRAARRAYAASEGDQGDLFLLVGLTLAIVGKREPPAEALELATAQHRPVRLPLLLYGKPDGDREPGALGEAMKSATAGQCQAPSPDAVLTVRQAVHDFQRGERARALSTLDRVLEEAVQDGLTVPRQLFRYRQNQGDKVFTAEQSLSLGNHLLRASGTFQIGLGYQSKQAHEAGMTISFADATSADAQREAARYYAHTAALAAIYHFAAGEPAKGVGAARKAIGTWAVGVVLGETRVAAGPDTAAWTGDASAAIAVAAQLAASSGHAFIAGDLWTLARASLDEDADDAAIDRLLDPPPASLRNIPEVDAVLPAARRSLQLVAASLPCTSSRGDLAAYQRVDCARYPEALGLRMAEALPALPRLRSGAESGDASCLAWRRLDEFAVAADQGRYEPDKFVAALDALRASGRADAAASLLARQRHAQHCSPALVAHARALAARSEIGVHLRADLLSIAVNCSSGQESADDLVALDDLTEQLAVPSRSFEVLLFATQLAVGADRYEALSALSGKPGFVKRWLGLSPELGTAALLLHHAAAAGAGKEVDREATLPFYRLLCTTFSAKERGPSCNAITLLRGSAPASEKARLAKEALSAFVKQALATATGGP